MTSNKRSDRHLPGDQGQPVCLGCKEKIRFGTDHDGGTIQWCRCGEFELATIRLPKVPEKPPRVYKAFGRPKPDKRVRGDLR